MKPLAQRSVAILVAALVTVTSCDRTPRLVPASADSLSVSQDSVSILSRMASEKWESGQPEQAAALSARVVRTRLETRGGDVWSDRARELLDSLGVAAEVVGHGRIAVVNLFSRAEVEGGSWPYIFWSEGGAVHLQTLEGRGMRLLDATVRGFGDDGATDAAELAVVWGRRAAAGQQPLLLTWRHARGGRWDLAQTLGPDSLGGTGSGQFDDQDLVTKTFRPTPWFDECATCPHVFHERRFTWAADGFARQDDRIVASPYATFTSFLGALIGGDRESAKHNNAYP